MSDELHPGDGELRERWLRDLRATGVARFSEYGRIESCNEGFRLLSGWEGREGVPCHASDVLVNPTFSELQRRAQRVDASLVFEGIVNLGRYGEVCRSAPGRVYRDGQRLLLVTDYDVEEAERVRDAMVQMNDELANVQRKLAGELHARSRAERAAQAKTDQLEKAVKELERSNRELNQYASILSHDLTAPLAAMLLGADRLERRVAAGEDTEEALNVLRESVEQMRGMMNSLLTYSRVGAGDLSFHACDLRAVITRVVRMLAPDIEKARAEIEIGVLPPVLGEENLLGELFQNLLQNALKYRGDARLQVRIFSIDGGDAFHIFAVEDNGIGIAPEHADRIFGIFQRVSTADGGPVGQGVGLAVCRKIVELQGGRIWVESERGQGASFQFTLPSVPAP